MEKYRPAKLEEVVGQDEIVERLQAYVKAGRLPHLLFFGPPGVGKTACAVALARENFGDSWVLNFKEMNASDERGIEVVRNDIKNFARTSPFDGADFKIIFLDEADALTPPAQAALRRTMERFSSICRFILSCNYSSKIIVPIQSRCVVYRFHPLNNDTLQSRIEYIAEKEGVEINDDALDAINYVALGDMRRAINALQSTAVLGRKIDAHAIYQVTALAHPKEIAELVDTALGNDLEEAIGRLNDLFDQGLSAEDMIRQIHRTVLGRDIRNGIKVKLIEMIGETEFRITEGADERLQLEALIARFFLTTGQS